MVHPLPFVVVDSTIDDRQTLAVASIAASSTAMTAATSAGTLVTSALGTSLVPLWVRVGAS